MSRSTSGAFGTGPPEGQTLIPVGSHISVTDISSVYTPDCPVKATMALVQAFGQNVRYTLDGTVPTTSMGFRLTAGDAPSILPFTDLTTLKFLEEAGGATLELQWGF